MIKIEFNGYPVIGYLLNTAGSGIVILVDRGAGRETGRYVTANAWTLTDREWYAGTYRNDLTDALRDLVRRATSDVLVTRP